MSEYLIIEGTPNTSEYIFWKWVVQFKGRIFCCNGNTSVFNVLNSISGLLNPGDEVYVCYDTVNRYSSVIGSCVSSNLSVLKNKLNALKTTYSVKCYLLKDLCFEAMLLRLVNIIPKVLDPYGLKMQAFVSEVYADSSTVHPQTYTDALFNEARKLQKTNEEYVASILHDATCKTHLCVTKGALGRCWICDCGFQNVAEKTMYAYYDWLNSVQGICRSASNPVCSLCGHLFSNMNNSHLFSSYIVGYKRDIILNDLCNGDWHNLFTDTF